MRNIIKMKISRRVFCHVCQLRAAVSTPTRWQCTNPCTQEQHNNVHNELTGQRRKRRRAADESIFAKYGQGLPQFEKSTSMTMDELESQLTNSKFYDQDGVIALNKPAGVTVSGGSQGVPNILEVLPQLVESIGKPSAEIAKAADRDSSGLILLGENKQVARRLDDAFLMARRRNQLIRKYWALTVGIPSPTEGTIDFPISPEKMGDHTLMVPCRHPSKGNFERKEVYRCRTEYQVLSANQHFNCSLLELKPLRLRKHQFQVHLSDKLCCILGDRIYSNRIQDILGVPVLVDPHHAAIGTQSLPESIQQALGLRAWHMSRIMLFVHWYQVTLPKWHKNKDAIITATPPGYFIEALQRLGLYSQSVEETLMEN